MNLYIDKSIELAKYYIKQDKVTLDNYNEMIVKAFTETLSDTRYIVKIMANSATLASNSDKVFMSTIIDISSGIERISIPLSATLLLGYTYNYKKTNKRIFKIFNVNRKIKKLADVYIKDLDIESLHDFNNLNINTALKQNELTYKLLNADTLWNNIFKSNISKLSDETCMVLSKINLDEVTYAINEYNKEVNKHNSML